MSHNAIRFGRMPEAEKRKLVAGLTASEISCQNPQVADLKAFSKHIYNAYLKNFNMTKKKARGILTGKASSTPPFVIHDMDTLWQAEKGLVWKQLVNGIPPYTSCFQTKPRASTTVCTPARAARVSSAGRSA